MASAKIKIIAATGIALYLASGAKGGAVHDVAAAVGSAPVAGSGGSANANVTLGQQMAAGYGWTGSDWNCLYTLWQRESGWVANATYPSTTTSFSAPAASITTAYGIPQALPAQKMASAGADWQTNPATQVRWGLAYVRSTYGDPCTALAFEETHQGY